MTKPPLSWRRPAADDASSIQLVPLPTTYASTRLPSGCWLTSQFDAPRVSSDGGLPWLAHVDATLGLCEGLAACIPDWRHGPVRHSLAMLVRQRVFQIACGYADQNDAGHLRTDPIFKLACGRAPESGPALASQPTLSRLENAVDRHALERLAEALVTVYLRDRGRRGTPRHLVLDLGSDNQWPSPNICVMKGKLVQQIRRGQPLKWPWAASVTI